MEYSINSKLEGWARWRLTGNYNNLGIGPSFLQRCLEGMPGTNCPTCSGTGRVPGKLYNLSHPKVDCQTCNSSGKVKMDPGGSKINPAFVRVTKRSAGNPVYERLDRLICELGLQKKTKRMYQVVMAEYCRTHGSGSQTTIARRLDWSYHLYRKTLFRARKMLEIGMK